MNSETKHNGYNKCTLERKELNACGTPGKAILSSVTKAAAHLEGEQLGLPWTSAKEGTCATLEALSRFGCPHPYTKQDSSWLCKVIPKEVLGRRQICIRWCNAISENSDK